jgi:hypothetical protein
MPARSQPGGPHWLPFPTGHDIIPAHWREGAVGQDEPRVFKVCRPPPKPAVLTQGELPGTQSLGCWAN